MTGQAKPIDKDNPFTTRLMNILGSLHDTFVARGGGPMRGYIVLPRDDFEALKRQMVDEEFGRWFWCKPRRKKPDDRRSVMIAGIMIYSEEARPTGNVDAAPPCPHRNTDPVPVNRSRAIAALNLFGSSGDPMGELQDAQVYIAREIERLQKLAKENQK